MPRPARSTVAIVATSVMLAIATMLAACSSTVDGTATRGTDTGGATTSVTGPTGTTDPPRTTAPRPAPPPAPTAGPGAGALPLPTQGGYAFLETRSGQTRCQVSSASVDCEAPFTDSPLIDGYRANGVSVTPDGAVRWVSGNLGDIPTTPLNYARYSAFGWTIDATASGTRFTCDETGHGMVVAVEGVDVF